MAVFSEKMEAEIKGLLGRHPSPHTAILPVLWLAAREYGVLTGETMNIIAQRLGVPAADVLSTATFYTMYPKEKRGRYHLQVCTNVACSLLGAEHVVRLLERKIGVERGQTTKDGAFTLSEVECLGSCGSAPAMMVNGTYFENLDEAAVDAILQRCRSGADIK
jgi:NADH-quinone oxidoreductase E subunit